MEKIYEPDDSFDFSKMSLLSPSSMPGGNYFIKFRINNNPLYIQPPKCVSKSAIFKSGKKYYCDLMFTNENENFIRWMENLENYCQKQIFDHRSKWFETELDEHDIENSFTSPLKLFKSGKFYISRTNVPTMLGKCSLKIYNEDEQEVDIELIKENTNVITILEIQGIKCSSKNFQIEIEIKQMMIFKQNNLFEKCIFTANNSRTEPNMDERKSTTGMFSIVKDGAVEEKLSLRENVDVLPNEFVHDNNNIELAVSEGFVEIENRRFSDQALLAKQNLDSEKNEHDNNNIELAVSEGFAKPLENLRFSGQAEQNLDSFPYATKGCSVEDPKGPLTRISKADSENNENDEENIFLEKHINSETEGFTESLASLDASGAKENLDSFPYATKGCSVEDPNGPLTRISKADSEKNETDNDSKNILEVNVDIEDLSNNDTIFIKKRNDIYYQMYKEAKRKAKMARDLAISSYLEAKHIKNTYMIENEDSDSDFDEESFEGIS